MPESKSGALPLGDSPTRDLLALMQFVAIATGWVEGFEPSTFGTTIRRANQLCHTHHTDKLNRINVPEGIRTPDPRLRRPLLYPAELLTHIQYIWLLKSG